MRKFIYVLILLSSFLNTSCEKDDIETSECVSTTLISHPLENEAKTITNYYNSEGYIYRSEVFYHMSESLDYETYKYDANDRIKEYLHSSYGSTKFEYNNYGISEVRNFDENKTPKDSYIYIYDNEHIIKRERYFGVNYAENGLDSAYLSFYHNGRLDSIKIKRVDTVLNNPVTTEFKTVYKYDEIGNLIERSNYNKSFDDDKIKLKSIHLYSYNKKNELIRFEYSHLGNNFETDKYKRYFYNDYGNLILTKVFDSNDNLVNLYETIYEGEFEKKLIEPEINNQIN